MNRPICALTIIFIFIIIVLYKIEVDFLGFNKIYELDEISGKFECTILGIKSEKEYKKTYLVKIIKVNNIQINVTENDLKEYIKILKDKKFLLDIKNNVYEEKLEYGDVVIFDGTYNKPNSKRNYGGYDYSLYLKTQKIYGTIEGTQIKLKSKNKGSYINRGIISLKEYIKSTLKANLSENEAELCIGLVIGDRTNLKESIEEDFKTSNLTHMLAVSGSHFVYIILAVTYINKFLRNKKLGQILMLIVIILFMNLTGNTGSVVRSGIMAIMTIMASIFHRKIDIWNSMSLAMLIQLIINPYIIFDIGVQLSYGGVIGIVTLNKEVNILLEKIYQYLKSFIKIKGKTRNKKIAKIIQKYGIVKYIKESISVTVSANIVIIPIMMYHFNTISLSFFISNLLAGAILGIIVLYAFLLIFIYIIFQKFIAPLFLILNLMLKLLIFIAHICSLMPFSKIFVVTPKIIFIIIFYSLLYLVFRKIKEPKNVDTKFKNLKVYLYNITCNKYYKKCIFSLIVITIILNFSIPIILSKRNNLEINFIDVGQGDSTLVRVNNKNILIDGGGSNYSSTFDVGEMTLFPYLLDRGINKLDYVIISHFDSDHSQGLNYIMKNLKVKNALISSLGQESSEYTTFINLAKEQGTNIIYVKMGDIIKMGDMTIEILFPNEEKILDNAKNNNALVFKILWKNIAILFTGDIEQIAEEKILTLYQYNIKKLEASILKVAHHGSKSSSIKSFLEAVNPKIALIGVGEDNNFGHPNNGVIERLENIGCKIYRTDEYGEITIKFKSRITIDTILKK